MENKFKQKQYQQSSNTQNEACQSDISQYKQIFEKLDHILAKRQDGIMKSALKDNGYTDEETKKILTKYDQNKAEKVARLEEAFREILAGALSFKKEDKEGATIHVEALNIFIRRELQ